MFPIAVMYRFSLERQLNDIEAVNGLGTSIPQCLLRAKLFFEYQ